MRLKASSRADAFQHVVTLTTLMEHTFAHDSYPCISIARNTHTARVQYSHCHCRILRDSERPRTTVRDLVPPRTHLQVTSHAYACSGCCCPQLCCCSIISHGAHHLALHFRFQVVHRRRPPRLWHVRMCTSVSALSFEAPLRVECWRRSQSDRHTERGTPCAMPRE